MFLIAYGDLNRSQILTAVYSDDIFVPAPGNTGYPFCFDSAEEADQYREEHEITSIIIEIPTDD